MDQSQALPLVSKIIHFNQLDNSTLDPTYVQMNM